MAKLSTLKIPADARFEIICNIICSYFGTNMEYVKETADERYGDIVIVRKMLFYFFYEYIYPEISKKKMAQRLGFNHTTGLHHHVDVKSKLAIGDNSYLKHVKAIHKLIKLYIVVNNP